MQKRREREKASRKNAGSEAVEIQKGRNKKLKENC